MGAQENKQLIEKMLNELAQGSADTLLGAIADDVVWELPGIPEAGYTVKEVYEGRDGTMELLGAVGELSEPLVFEPREYIADGDKVVVFIYEKSRAIPTGKEFDQYFVHIWTVRDGKITRCRMVEDTYAIAAAYRQ